MSERMKLQEMVAIRVGVARNAIRERRWHERDVGMLFDDIDALSKALTAAEEALKAANEGAVNFIREQPCGGPDNPNRGECGCRRCDTLRALGYGQEARGG